MKIQATLISSGEAEGKVIFFNPKFTVNDYKNKIVVIKNLNKRRDTYKLRHGKGVISEKGGITSHGSIILRELGLPAVILPEAKRVLENDDWIKINNNGIIEINLKYFRKIRKRKEFYPKKIGKWLLVRPRTYCPLKVDLIKEGVEKTPKVLWGSKQEGQFKQTKKGYWYKNYPEPKIMLRRIITNPAWFKKTILKRKKIFSKLKFFIAKTSKKIEKPLALSEYIEILKHGKKFLTEVRPYTDLTQLTIDELERQFYKKIVHYFPLVVAVKYFDKLTRSYYTRKIIKTKTPLPARRYDFILPAPKLEKFIKLAINYNKKIHLNEEEKFYLGKIPPKMRKKIMNFSKILPLLTELSEETTYNIIILMNRLNYVIEKIARKLKIAKKIKSEKEILYLTLNEIGSLSKKNG